MIQYGFMKSTELKFVSLFSLNLLSQTIMSHTSREVSAELCRTLLGTNNLQLHFAF